ncbi:rhomboid family intramembrane serine protease [Fervidibacillus albus]|uniref:Rhomboid family intramembrane serine protease n=1 Tax=Fervidibacillus albus TaxID=2980026 RepID=A0A9E8LUW2_9BACI|nr:rhomboid family intramembrane serine protease [Fervidibacillus albus]WAA09249.1 rhomboid family intramembrane serine protease [Fervidibacillus albus]
MQRQPSIPQFRTVQPPIIFLLTIQVIFYFLVIVPIFPNRTIYEKMVGVNILLSSGEWWRIITPAFIHLSFHHFLFNGFSLYLFGSMLGERIKDWGVLFIFLSSAIFANLFTYLFAPPAFVHAGASGGVFGFIGVFASLILSRRLPNEQAITVGTIIGIASFLSLFQMNANLFAHIGGFLWGFICGFAIGRKREKKDFQTF